MEKFPMNAVSMSRYMIKASLGIYLKNRRKTEFMQQRVNVCKKIIYYVINAELKPNTYKPVTLISKYFQDGGGLWDTFKRSEEKILEKSSV